MRYDVAPYTYSRLQINGDTRTFTTLASRDTHTGEWLMVADGTEILDVHVREHAAALNGQTNPSGRYHVADVFPDGNPCNDAWFDSLVPAFKEAERRRESYRARGYRSGFCVCCWDVENDGEQVSECDYEDAIFIGPLQEAS